MALRDWGWRIAECGLLAMVLGCGPGGPRCQAQFIGYTSPQTVQNVNLLNAVTVATASSTVANIGQSVHFVTYRTGGTVTQLDIVIEGSSDNTNWYQISGTGTATDKGALMAVSYLPFIRANLKFLSGTSPTVTADYFGTSVGGPATGIFNQSGTQVQVLSYNDPANTSKLYTFTLPPNGGSGVLLFTYSGTDCTPNSFLTVKLGADKSNIVAVVASSAAAAVLDGSTSSPQVLQVPNLPSGVASVNYASSCGASTSTYFLAYIYSPGPYSIPCQGTAAVSLTASGDTQVIGASAGTVIYICHLSLSFASGVDLKLDSGTGTNCATGTIAVSGTYKNVLTMTLDRDRNPIILTRRQAFCINLATAVTGGGTVEYAQF